MPLFHEVGMLLKVLILIVFEHEHPAFAQEVVLEDEVHQGVVMLTVVRRVGKDEVILHFVLVQEAEDIGADDKQLFHIKLVGSLTDEFHTTKVLINGNDFWAASRNQFVGAVICRRWYLPLMILIFFFLAGHATNRLVSRVLIIGNE